MTLTVRHDGEQTCDAVRLYYCLQFLRFFRPHLCCGRQIKEGQLLHHSAWKHIRDKEKKYTPAASGFPSSWRIWSWEDPITSWENIRDAGEISPGFVVQDSDSPAAEFLTQLRNSIRESRKVTQADIDNIMQLTSTSELSSASHSTAS